MRNQKIRHRKKVNGRNEIALPAIALNESRLNSPIKRQRDRQDWKTRSHAMPSVPLSFLWCSALQPVVPGSPSSWLRKSSGPGSPSHGCTRETQGSELGKPSLMAHFFFLYVQSHENCFVIDILVVLSGIVNLVYYSVWTGSRDSID